MRGVKLPLLRLRPPDARWWLAPERPGCRGGAGAARACAGPCTSMRLRRSSFKERSCQSGAGWQLAASAQVAADRCGRPPALAASPALRRTCGSARRRARSCQAPAPKTQRARDAAAREAGDRAEARARPSGRGRSARRCRRRGGHWRRGAHLSEMRDLRFVARVHAVVVLLVVRLSGRGLAPFQLLDEPQQLRAGGVRS
jgi:hypothetical protein